MTIKDAKLNFITDVATELFLEKSITEVTVKDISKAAGVGEATVYRYFSQKKNVVSAVAEKLQKQVFCDYFDLGGGKNGYEKLEKFFLSYLDVYEKDRRFFKFVSEFDAYVISEGGLSSEEYSSGIDLFRSAFLAAYREGLSDGSVRELPDPEVFYYASTHAMLEVCKKLATTGSIVKQDETTDKVAEISGLTGIMLYYLATPQV